MMLVKMLMKIGLPKMKGLLVMMMTMISFSGREVPPRESLHRREKVLPPKFRLKTAALRPKNISASVGQVYPANHYVVFESGVLAKWLPVYRVIYPDTVSKGLFGLSLRLSNVATPEVRQLTVCASWGLLQVGSPEMQEPVSNSDQGHDSATESASSRETWPVEPEHSNAAAASSGGAVKKVEMEKDIRNGIPKLQVIRGSSRIDRVSLREIARERVDLVVEKMKVMPEEHLEEIKNELRSILEGTGGSHHIEEFLYLQKFVQGRGDLTPTMLSMAHHVQLEILVAIKTGIQAFLHPSVTIPQSHLVEVFLYKRCRNIACQSALPAEECRCNVCANRNGFCNLCMCVICNKFDFEVNTCRWVGCDFCSHWTHTDCAIRVGQIGTGQSIKSSTGHAEMLFRCQACQKTSELFGWVKDVFQQCAPGWDRDALVRELEFVCKIFRLSEDPKGRNLFRKCANLIERLRNSSPDSVNPRMILHALRGLCTSVAPSFSDAM
ncbi:OBERON-like protein [Triticum urartu]|uniref:OBERON-like protein n=1 Tax=Triticum urartu TaxID=4572 RepID=M7Z1H7_TRIUA|nr:OBERON-like protein [Triticum urartu]